MYHVGLKSCTTYAVSESAVMSEFKVKLIWFTHYTGTRHQNFWIQLKEIAIISPLSHLSSEIQNHRPISRTFLRPVAPDEDRFKPDPLHMLEQGTMHIS